MSEQVIPSDELTRVLFDLGYFGAATWAEVENLSDADLAAALVKYQEFTGVTPTGLADAETAHQMRRLRCALPDFEMREEGKICMWPMKRVTYYPKLNLPGLTPEQAVQAYDVACSQWMAVCGLNLVRVPAANQANIYARSGTGKANGLDGRGGTLAWSELPCGVATNSQMEQCYDEAEKWNFNMAVAVICHELGHALGLPHLSTGNLMAPYYDPNTTKPQSGDISEMVQRYGTPTVVPPVVPPNPNPAPGQPPGPVIPPTGPSPGSPGEIDVSGVIRIEVNGVVYDYVLARRN